MIYNSPTSLYFYYFQQRHYETVRILIRSKRRGKTVWTFLNYWFFLELNDGRSFRTIEKSTIKTISCLLEMLRNYTYDFMIFE